MRTCRMSTERRTGGNVTEDGALGGDSRSISDDEVIGHAHMPRQDHVVAHSGASRDTDTSHDQASFADPDVVAHLNQVVKFGAPANNRVVDATPINAGIGSHFDFVLEDALPYVGDTAVFSSVAEIAESLPPDHCSGLENDAAADATAGIAHYPGPDEGVVADGDAITKRGALRDAAALTQTNVSTEHHKGPYRNVRAQYRSGADARAGVYPAGGRLGRIKGMEYPDESPVWIGDYDAGFWSGARGQRLRHENSTSTGAVELRGVAARDGKRQRIRPGAIQWTHPANADPPIAKQAAADQIGDRPRGKAPFGHDSGARFELLNHTLRQIETFVGGDDSVVG